MPNLYLIPTTLATENITSILLPNQLQQIKHLKYFIVETAKVARMHLKQLNLTNALQDLNIQELNKHKQNLTELIAPLANNHDMGLMSDCGLPAIADPGSQIVYIAHKNGYNIIPLIGPSSIFLALMSSGCNGQEFSFNGYLPIDAKLRQDKLMKMQDKIIKQNQTQIFIEAPFRNQLLFKIIVELMNPDILLTIAVDLMNSQQQIISKTIKEWKNSIHNLDINKRETIFVMGTPSV